MIDTSPNTTFDISRSYGLRPAQIQGRESHTTDLIRFDARIAEVESFQRAATVQAFHTEFWAFVRTLLVPCERTVGYHSEEDPTVAIPKAPQDIQGLGERVGQLGLLNPIFPKALAEACGLDETVVLTELLVAAKVGLLRMRWAPECIRCGSAVLVTDTLSALQREADCGGCGQHNELHSLDKVMVTFTFASDVLYVLANNYACTPSRRSMGYNAAFAPMAATNSGSGFRYSFGTGEGQLREALPAGRYRMHCPVSMTDNFLVVHRDAIETDEALEVPYSIAEMVVTSGSQPRKLVDVEHGRIHFDIYPDTHSFFVLWIQEDVDEETLLYLPEEERKEYTSAATMMTHPAFSLFEDHLVPGGNNVFDIAEVHLVFTDIVGSTDLYANLGDGQALALVHTYFEALFGAFAPRGRIVKTIGDSVMAAFPTGTAAIEAASEGLKSVQARCTNPVTGTPLHIRIGIHRGATLAVPVNGINDYFGQTVNIAARIENEAKASQCLISNAVLERTHAQDTFKAVVNHPTFSETEARNIALKGIKTPVTVRGFSLN